MTKRINGPRERRALGVMPDPLPPEAPVARVTLSRARSSRRKALMIAITGSQEARRARAAIEQGASSPYPSAASLPMSSCRSTSTGPVHDLTPNRRRHRPVSIARAQARGLSGADPARARSGSDRPKLGCANLAHAYAGTDEQRDR
jgi:hypothetical protein